MRVAVRLLLLIVLATLVQPAFAAFDIEGFLHDSDGNAITGNYKVWVEIQKVGDPDCVLYREEFEKISVDATGSFIVSVGQGEPTTGFENLQLDDVLKNQAKLDCRDGKGTFKSNYTPGSSDFRAIKVEIETSAGNSVTLGPTTLTAVPYSTYANYIDQHSSKSLLRVEDNGTPKDVNPLSSADADELRRLIEGSSDQYMPRSTAAGASLPSFSSGGPTLPQPGSIWYDSTSKTIKFYDGVTTQTLGAGGGGGSGGVTSITAGAGLTGGTITSSGTIALEDYGTPGTYFKVTTDAKGRVTSGATSLTEADLPTIGTAGKVSGDAITSGTIGGNTSVNTSGSVTSSSISTRLFDLYDSDNSNYIRFQSPATGDLTSNYTLTWPATAGSNGQVLTTDGSGKLSWSSGAAPSGNAGGDLSGAYPNPELATLHTGGSGVKITYDKKGRVTGSSSLVASDIPGLDWSKITSGKPTTLDGYGISDAVKNSGGVVSIEAGADASKPAAGVEGRIYVATDTQKIYRDNGTSWIVVASVDSGGGGGGGGGTVTQVTANSPLSVEYATTTPQISIMAAGPSSSGYLSQTDWNAFNLKLDSALDSGKIFIGNASNKATAQTPSGDVSMDIGGVFTITKIRGFSVSAMAPSDGQVLKYVGGTYAWTPANFSVSDLKTAGGVQQFANATCNASQTLTWSSLTDTFTCTNINGLDASAIASGTLDIARIPTGTTTGTVAAGDDWRIEGAVQRSGDTMTGALNLPSNGLFVGSHQLVVTGDKVGIGTATPEAALDVSGSIKASGSIGVGTTYDLCTPENEGAQKYNPETKTMQFCNGMRWTTIGGNTLVGTLSFPATPGCKWMTGSKTWASLDSGCSVGPSNLKVTGSVRTDSHPLNVRVDQLWPGTYRVRFNIYAFPGDEDHRCAFRIYDGTNAGPVSGVHNGDFGLDPKVSELRSLEAVFNYDTPRPFIEFSLQAMAVGSMASTCHVSADTNGGSKYQFNYSDIFVTVERIGD